MNGAPAYLRFSALFVTRHFSFEVECETTLLSLLFFDVFQCVTLSALFHLFALIKYSTKSLQEHFFSRESGGFWGGCSLGKGRDGVHVSNGAKTIYALQFVFKFLSDFIHSNPPFLHSSERGKKQMTTSIYILNTPYCVFSIGAFIAADSPNPNTVRVSFGSITPSSHSRAVA